MAVQPEAGERGSAVVETALVTAVLSGLFLAILQIGLAVYVRTTVIACAADGARYGANADRGRPDAEDYARERIRASLPDRYAEHVHAELVPVDGVQTVQVSVTVPLPVVGFVGASSMTVQAHAVDESPRQPSVAVP